MNYVCGIDLSLTATGIAVIDLTKSWQPPHYYTDTLKPPAKLDDLDRIEWLLSAIFNHSQADSLTVLEGPAYGAQGRGQHERAGLWWIVRRWLDKRDIPVAVAPPSNVKKYATGNGLASKDVVLMAAARRFPLFSGDNNAADALWLAAAGADHLGYPLVAMPESHRAALDKVAWPVLNGATT